MAGHNTATVFLILAVKVMRKGKKYKIITKQWLARSVVATKIKRSLSGCQEKKKTHRLQNYKKKKTTHKIVQQDELAQQCLQRTNNSQRIILVSNNKLCESLRWLDTQQVAFQSTKQPTSYKAERTNGR